MLAASLVLWSFAAAAQDAVPGEYLVRFKSTSSASVQGKIQGKANLKGVLPAKGTFHLSDVDPALLDQLKSDPDVEYVEPNFTLQSIETIPESGPMTAESVPNYSQTGSAVQATAAWSAASAYSATNRPIVAIIDSGIAKTHPVFVNSNAVWVNPGEVAANGVDDDLNGFVDDVYGWNFVSGTNNPNDDANHGTHVAGIVLGATQDILKSPIDQAKIRIMPLKFLDANGSGNTSAAVSAIYYAVNMGAKVINCSWGGGSYSKALMDAMTYAYNSGVLVVTAAGNYTSNNDATDMFPANYPVPSNIAVAATTDTDQLASFSNYGHSTVAVGSPGVYVYSTLPGGYFGSMSGTSMAAPFVAGSAALALREATQLSGYQMKNLIVSSSDVVSYLSNSTSSGGRINTLKMVQSAKTMTSVSPYQPVYSAMSYESDRAPASSGQAAGCGMVSAVGGIGGAGGAGAPPGAAGALVFLFAMPLVAWAVMRWKAAQNPANQRKHERFLLNSDIVIKAGDRELVGTMKTISMGGLSFNVDEALERGGTVTLKVTGPDGKDAVEVEGRIVWSEKNESYGVQFAGVKDAAKNTLFGWTKQLVRQN